MIHPSSISPAAPPLPEQKPAPRPLQPPFRRPQPVHPPLGFLPAVQSLGYIIVVAIFVITFSLQPFRIPSASMEPTLLVGDFLLVDKHDPHGAGSLSPFPQARIRRGDVIVFHYPVDPSLHLVKRVIGLPGETLRMRSGRVFINGKPLTEPYALYTESRVDNFRDNFPHLQSTDPDVDSRWWTQLHHLVQNGELRIPSGHYFVLGDNRNDSEDSRYWGLVPQDNIVGEPFLVYFSLRDPGDGDSIALGNAAQRPYSDRAPRKFSDTLLDLARWDRTLHVVR